MVPVSRCRAKGGPLKCRYHGGAARGALAGRISSLEHRIEDLLAGEYDEAELAAIEKELELRKREQKMIQREDESRAVRKSMGAKLSTLQRNGTSEVRTAPASISIKGSEVKVKRGHRLPPSVRKSLIGEGLGVQDIMEIEPKGAGAESFHALMESTRDGNKFASSVYVYDKEEYEGMRLFVAEDGSSGYALKYHDDIDKWDIVSVFSMPSAAPISTADGITDDDVPVKSGSRMAQCMLLNAIANGGTMLDCFDTVLPDLYASVGFKEVGRDSWNEEYKPDGWDYDTYAAYNGGRPDVVYMEFDPKGYSEPNSAKLASIDFSFAE